MANPESNWYSWQCSAWVLNEAVKAVSWKSPDSRRTHSFAWISAVHCALASQCRWKGKKHGHTRWLKEIEHPEWWNQVTGSWKQQWQTQNPIDTPDNAPLECWIKRLRPCLERVQKVDGHTFCLNFSCAFCTCFMMSLERQDTRAHKMVEGNWAPRMMKPSYW